MLPVTAVALGVGITMVGLDENRVFDRNLYYPLVVIGQFFFVCATLSVSFVWESRVNKIIPLTHAVRPSLPAGPSSSFSSNIRHSTRAKIWCMHYWIIFLKSILGLEALIAASLSAITVAMMVSYVSPLYISAATSMCCLVVSVTLAATGSRLGRLLDVPIGAFSLSEEELDNRSQRHVNIEWNSIAIHRDEGKSKVRLSSSRATRQQELAGNGDTGDSFAQAEIGDLGLSAVHAILRSKQSPLALSQSCESSQKERVIISPQFLGMRSRLSSVAAQIRGTANFISR